MKSTLPVTILKGVKVLEIGLGVASGWCGRLFSDFGAEVYRFDTEKKKDTVGLDGLMLQWLDFGKISSKNKILPNIDVVIVSENEAKNFQLCYPNAVIIDITWFGDVGPYSKWQGSDLIIQALSGMVFPNGPKSTVPIYLGETEASIIGGVWAFITSLVGLLNNEEKSFYSVNIFEANMILGELQSADSIRFTRPNSREGLNRYFPTCPVGIYPCKVGWLGITVITPAQWRTFCLLLELDEFLDNPDYGNIFNRSERIDCVETLIIRGLQTKTASEWAELGRKYKIPMVLVPNAEELINQSVFDERDAFVEIEINNKKIKAPKSPLCHIVYSAPKPFKQEPKKALLNEGSFDLSKIKIADFSMGWAGPLATRILADFGAEVIKIEAGRYPDWWRAVDWSAEAIASNQYEESRRFAALNRGKKSISLDLKTPEGLRLAQDLTSKVDIVIENQAAGVMDKLGIGWDIISDKNENVIMVSMSAFGHGNTLSDTRAYGSTLEHASGTPSFRGDPEWSPMMAHIAYGDPIAGLYGAASMLASLYVRKKLQKGLNVDLSMVECMLPFAASALLNYGLTKNEPKRIQNRHSTMVPHGVFRCDNGQSYVAIAVKTNKAWQKFCKLIGNDIFESWLTKGLTQRRKIEHDIENKISIWVLNKDPVILSEKLQEIGVLAAPVSQPESATEDKHLAANKFFHNTNREYVGHQKQVGLPVLKNKKRFKYCGDAPFLGADTYAVLKDNLDLNKEAVNQLFDNDISSYQPTQLRSDTNE